MDVTYIYIFADNSLSIDGNNLIAKLECVRGGAWESIIVAYFDVVSSSLENNTIRMLSLASMLKHRPFSSSQPKEKPISMPIVH